jgi:hypothetical protein
MKRSVIAQIKQVKQFLSKVWPDIQTTICPQLAYHFSNDIKSHYDIMEIFVNRSISVESRHDDMCVAMFRSVLTPNLHDYNPEILAEFFTHSLVVQTLDSVPGLRSLYLEHTSRIRGSNKLATSIRHLKNLQYFSYSTHCTDEVVRKLGLHCRHLTKVSFLNSRGVTNDCVPHLLRLRKLQFLNLFGTQIDNTHYGLLLSQLPQIADIRFRNTEDDILHHITLDTLNTITNAYGFVTDIGMLVRTCPNIRNLELHLTDRDLSGLITLTQIRDLTISFGDYLICHLNAVLTGIGAQLTELKMRLVTCVNLHDILTLCPALEILELSFCEYLPRNADTPFNPQLPHFGNLISLRIGKLCNDQTDYRFIRCYVNLEIIFLFAVDIFTEEFMREVVNRGTLANLTECYIHETLQEGMTFEALQILIQHCSYLKVFGYTNTLVRLSTENVLELRRQMLLNNFDLDILSD